MGFPILVRLYLYIEPAPWCLKSQATQLFIQQLDQANNKEHIKVSHYHPLCRESTRHWWFPSTKDQQCGKHFHIMASSCFVGVSLVISDIKYLFVDDINRNCWALPKPLGTSQVKTWFSPHSKNLSITFFTLSAISFGYKLPGLGQNRLPACYKWLMGSSLL